MKREKSSSITFRMQPNMFDAIVRHIENINAQRKESNKRVGFWDQKKPMTTTEVVTDALKLYMETHNIR